MMTEIDSRQAVGKTLKALSCDYDDVLVLVFTDDTFCVFRPAIEYPESDYCVQQTDLGYHDLSRGALVDLGIMTEAEVDKQIEEDRLRQLDEQKEHRRQIYHRLKEEFEQK